MDQIENVKAWRARAKADLNMLAGWYEGHQAKAASSSGKTKEYEEWHSEMVYRRIVELRSVLDEWDQWLQRRSLS